MSRSLELAAASTAVMARRLGLGFSALIDPLRADHTEFARMVPEKAEAFARASMILAGQSVGIVQQITKFAVNETIQAERTMRALGACRTPGDVAATQAGYTVALFGRALAQAMTLATMAVRAQGEAMAPIHSAASENARRLTR